MNLSPGLAAEITRPTPEDYPAMSEVITRCLHETNAPDYPGAVIEGLVERHSPSSLANILDSKFSLVLKLRGEVVGTGVLSGSEITTVFVLPDLQGKGLGKRIMVALEQEAVRQGLRKVELHSSITAVPFYEKLGYKTENRVNREVGGESVVMFKDLGG